MSEQSQDAKHVLYNELKAAGWVPDKHYRDYSVEDLNKVKGEVVAKQLQEVAVQPPVEAAAPAVPVAPRDQTEVAGQRMNSNAELKPLRIDEATGRTVYQEEVVKPAFPKPRGRRILRQMVADSVEDTAKVGEYTETFEVEGRGPKRASEVKITMPSYQVGIVKDKRFPWKIHTYNGNEGFDFFEVNDYYGGAELVPPTVKRKYVSNSLCYDIQSVIRAVNDEFRQQSLAGAHRPQPQQLQQRSQA